MGEDLPTSNVEHDIAQLPVSPKHIQLSKGDLRVLFADVWHPCWRAVAVQKDVHPFDGVIVKRFNL